MNRSSLKRVIYRFELKIDNLLYKVKFLEEQNEKLSGVNRTLANSLSYWHAKERNRKLREDYYMKELIEKIREEEPDISDFALKLELAKFGYSWGESSEYLKKVKG